MPLELSALRAALIEFGTQDISHSQRKLLNHLEGTYHLLEKWRNPKHVCDAGMFHSIYGTVYFGSVTIDPSHRDRVRFLIHSDAERLAYLFCAINRQELFEQSEFSAPYFVTDRFNKDKIKVSAREFEQLFEIEIANFIEQVPDKGCLDQEKLNWYVEYFGRCHGFVSDGAYSAYREFFELEK
jgi:hypothetical protein